MKNTKETKKEMKSEVKSLKDDKVKKTKDSKKKENKHVEKKHKENIFKRIEKYFKGVFKEIKRIRWTSGKDLLKYSIATVMFVLFFGIYFYAVDWIALLVRSIAK